jgi:hypothetical protein
MGFNVDILSAITISGETFYGNGSNITGNTINEIINSPTQNPLNVNTSNNYLPITGNDILQDVANNYITWTNGSNNGTGFNPWLINTLPNTGVFIGNPSVDGMGTSGIGTNAFALFATDGSNYVSTSRTFTSGMNVGDVFSFYWAINFDANGGNKGFDLKAGGVTIFNANNNNTSTITSNLSSPNNIIDGGYGTTPMLVTLTRTSDIFYNITITSRSGGPTYSAPINSSLVVNEINFYCGAQGDSSGQRNLFFNQLLITKKADLFKITVDDLGSLFNNSVTFTGGTVPGETIFEEGLSATTISGDTFYGDGSNLTNLVPYKVYSALISQSSTSSPTVTVLENTLGYTPLIGRNTQGIYVVGVTASTIGELFYFITERGTNVNQEARMTLQFNTGIYSIGISTTNSGSLTDGILSNHPIEIRVYNV